MTYFFSNRIEIEVEKGIKQGDTRFFIDNIQRQLTGSITRFTLPQGLHSFEIEVVPGTTVVNPNFSVRIFATDNNDGDDSSGQNPTSPTLKDRLNKAVSVARSIKSKLTTANRKSQNATLSSLKKQLKTIDKLVRSSAKQLSKKQRSSLTTALQNVTRARTTFEKAKSSRRSSARANLLKSIQRLQTLVKKSIK